MSSDSTMLYQAPRWGKVTSRLEATQSLFSTEVKYIGLGLIVATLFVLSLIFAPEVNYVFPVMFSG
jgi:hypothetical protein